MTRFGCDGRGIHTSSVSTRPPHSLCEKQSRREQGRIKSAAYSILRQPSYPCFLTAMLLGLLDQSIAIRGSTSLS